MLNFKKNISNLKSKKLFLYARLLWENFKTKFRSSNYLYFKKQLENSFKSQFVKKENILICTFSGTNYLIKMIDKLFYISLKIKGYNIFILECGKSLNLCQISDYTFFKTNNYKKHQSKICNYCKKGFDIDFNDNFFSKINLKKKLKNVKFSEKKNILHNLNFSERKFDEIIYSAVIRFMGKSEINPNTKDLKSLKKEYVLSGLIFLYNFNEILKKYKITKMINHHGIYLPHGLILHLAIVRNIDCYTWHQAYRNNSITVYKNDNQHNFFQKLKKWDNFEFLTKNKIQIINYLKSRFNQDHDWIKFQTTKYKKKILKQKNKQTYMMATNVSWDAQIHYKKNFFKNMEEFIIYTIKYFEKNLEKKLIIRAHPGELLGQVPSSNKVEEIIKKKFTSVPPNVTIISSSDDTNTYEVADKSDVVIVYASKIAIELASFGKPVICCGEAWIKNKGITFDPKNKKEFLKLLNKDPEYLKKISFIKKNLALKFAYYFFFKRTFKINYIKNSLFPKRKLDIKNLINKKYKNDKEFDYLLKCILNKKDVIKK